MYTQSGEIGVNIKTAFDLDDAKVDYSLQTQQTSI